MTETEEILAQPIGKALFCAVDVETSGLYMSSRLVEIGAVRFGLDGTSYEFQTLVNPCEPISQGAIDIHGITNEMVQSAPLAADVLPGLLNFMRGCVFIAHNAPFDARMIGNELARSRLDAPENPVLCTVKLGRKKISGPQNFRLATLVSYLELGIENLHNALPDAHAARGVFLEGVKDLPGETPVSELPGVLGAFASVAPPSVDVDGIRQSGDTDELAAIARAKLAIEMEYGPSPHGPVVVTPTYLFEGKGNRYMSAYCHRDGVQKTYRLDRILSFRLI